MKPSETPLDRKIDGFLVALDDLRDHVLAAELTEQEMNLLIGFAEFADRLDIKKQLSVALAENMTARIKACKPVPANVAFTGNPFAEGARLAGVYIQEAK